MKNNVKGQDDTQSRQSPCVSDSILYQVVFGVKSHHHNSFEDLKFHPAFFKTKEDAKKIHRRENYIKFSR
jgi:hypothetical protein